MKKEKGLARKAAAAEEAAAAVAAAPVQFLKAAAAVADDEQWLASDGEGGEDFLHSTSDSREIETSSATEFWQGSARSETLLDFTLKEGVDFCLESVSTLARKKKCCLPTSCS